MELSSLSAGCGPSFSITCRQHGTGSASASPGLPPTPLCPYLAQDEGHHVRGFPVAGVEEVGQGDGGEGSQGIRAIQRVVNALWAPPVLQDCGESWNEAFSGPHPMSCSPRCPHGMGWVGMTLTLDNLTGAGRSGGLCRFIALPEAPKAASGGRGGSHIHFGQEQGRVCLQGLRCRKSWVNTPRVPRDTHHPRTPSNRAPKQ